jgi:hypothetical protein
MKNTQIAEKKTSIGLPENVLTYLRLKSVAEGKQMKELILEAIKSYFKIGEGS